MALSRANFSRSLESRLRSSQRRDGLGGKSKGFSKSKFVTVHTFYRYSIVSDLDSLTLQTCQFGFGGDNHGFRFCNIQSYSMVFYPYDEMGFKQFANC